MTIFNKISGLAQKAKDNVVSKTVLSMDKRLEHSLSDNINTQTIAMKKISTYGLPSSVSVVAFDSVAGLLAVSGNAPHGYIKVFGKGISTTIMLPNQAGIKYLQFKTGYPVLVVIDNKNVIFTIDLRTKQVRHIVPAQEIITSLEYCTGSDWLFVGYANGFVDVFDVHLGTFTDYQIPNLVVDINMQDQKKSSGDLVVALHMHPTDLDSLLIGYESAVYLWNVREKSVRRIFSLAKLESNHPYRNGRLTCLAWSPNGTRFIAGYDDGCTHMWDIRNDNRPIHSRKLLQTSFVPTSDAKSTPTEPIYQMAWYTTDQKSCIVVAGGIDPHDIQGLSVLEFDLESDAKEAKKQTIMPLPVDLSHFVILGGTNPYSSLHNPFGIAVVGADHSLYVYSMDGMPLKLPPALDFLGPDVTNACHLPQLPDTAFKKLTAVTLGDRATRWLPITGGVAGPEHVYHINSNDLLLTIHKGEVIKFWDASYTGLRPLSHLTLRCLDDLGSRDNFLCCLDINKVTGAFSIGFVDGSVLVYEYIGDPASSANEQQQSSQVDISRNEKFINSCDDTLKEIGDLLNDMNENEQDQVEQQVENPNIGEPEQSSNTNPFLNNNDDDDKKPVVETQQQTSPNPFETEKIPSLPPRPTETEIKQTPTKSIFTNLNKTGNSAGFYAALKITLNATITSVVSVGESILALASVDGVVTVVDIYKQMVLLSLNIANLDFQNSQASQAQAANNEIANELSEADPNKNIQKKPASISSLKFFNTYSPLKVMTISTQLIVGLSNGHVYQFDLLNLMKPHQQQTELSVKLQPAASILETHIIDLKGSAQIAIDTELKEPPEVPVKSPLSRTPTTKTKSSTSSLQGNSPESSTDELNTRQRAASVSSVGSNSKRMVAIGKSEYRQQENPHFIIYTCLTAVQIVLAGFNVKLFNKVFKDIQIIKSQVVQSFGSSCLALVLSNGTLLLLSLPHLEPLFELKLPAHHLPEKLAECSISEDGRLVVWTGKYEMEQFAFMPMTSFEIGESVILFDSQKVMPTHPTYQQQQPVKKTWLNTVAGAFQKETLTLPEMDSLMGRIPMETAAENRRAEYMKKHQQQQEQSSSKGPGGVFSELGDKMNERGERLNELNQKFEDMSAASGDFLKAVKEYNERQAKKKWWEF